MPVRTLLAAFVVIAAPAFAAADSAPPASDRPEWTPSDGAVIAFDVLRNGSSFGEHVLTFSQQDGELSVETDVELKAGLGPITMFKYELQSKETWRDGRLIALKGQTNDDGEKMRVEATAESEGLRVEGTAYEGAVPADIIPASHWNIRQMFSDVMLSTENGELLDINIEPLGMEQVDVNGSSVEATRYRLKSDLDVDLWYDEQGRWVKLAFEARGQDIEYRLRDLYQ